MVNRKPSITTKELRAVQLKVEFVAALIKDTLVILTAYSLEVNCEKWKHSNCKSTLPASKSWIY